MSDALDPASILAEACKRGFSELLHWTFSGGSLFAEVVVSGLPGTRRVDVLSRSDVLHLDTCLAECEGCGLLWREDACLLYAARRLNTKPQPWAYSESEHINRLFDAIGAE